MKTATETYSGYSDVLATSLNVHAIDAACAALPAAHVWDMGVA